MSRAGRSNSGRLEPFWQQQVVMMEAVDDVSRSRVRGARDHRQQDGVVEAWCSDEMMMGGIEEQDGNCGKRSVQRGMGYLSRAVATKWAPGNPGQLVHASCAVQGCLSYALPGQVPRRVKARLALTWAARKGKPGLP